MMISQLAMTDIRYKLSILETLRSQGSNSKTRIVRKCKMNHQRGCDAANELIDAGLIDIVELSGDRHWISITKHGREALTLWTQLINLIIGGETQWL